MSFNLKLIEHGWELQPAELNINRRKHSIIPWDVLFYCQSVFLLHLNLSLADRVQQLPFLYTATILSN